MERYEYRFEIVPTKNNRYTGLAKTDDPFGQTLADAINETAKDGWEYLRTETVTETRRSGFFGTKKLQREFLVYRRQLHSNGMSLDTPLHPRRVKPSNVSNIEQLRARMQLAVGEMKQT